MYHNEDIKTKVNIKKKIKNYIYLFSILLNNFFLSSQNKLPSEESKIIEISYKYNNMPLITIRGTTYTVYDILRDIELLKSKLIIQSEEKVKYNNKKEICDYIELFIMRKTYGLLIQESEQSLRDQCAQIRKNYIEEGQILDEGADRIILDQKYVEEIFKQNRQMYFSNPKKFFDKVDTSELVNFELSGLLSEQNVFNITTYDLLNIIVQDELIKDQIIKQLSITKKENLEKEFQKLSRTYSLSYQADNLDLLKNRTLDELPNEYINLLKQNKEFQFGFCQIGDKYHIILLLSSGDKSNFIFESYDVYQYSIPYSPIISYEEVNKELNHYLSNVSEEEIRSKWSSKTIYIPKNQNIKIPVDLIYGVIDPRQVDIKKVCGPYEDNANQKMTLYFFDKKDDLSDEKLSKEYVQKIYKFNKYNPSIKVADDALYKIILGAAENQVELSPYIYEIIQEYSESKFS